MTILTLALGVGAATAVFSAVSSLLLHAVPYPGASRVMSVFQQPARGNNTGINVTITAIGGGDPGMEGERAQLRGPRGVRDGANGDADDGRTS